MCIRDSLKLIQLAHDILLEVLDGLGDGGQHVPKLIIEPLNLRVDHIVVHLPPTLLVDQIVVDIRLLGQPLHLKPHLLFKQQLSYVGNEGRNVMTAVLLLEQAGRTRQPFCALGVCAKILDGLRGELGATYLVI